MASTAAQTGKRWGVGGRSKRHRCPQDLCGDTQGHLASSSRSKTHHSRPRGRGTRAVLLRGRVKTHVRASVRPTHPHATGKAGARVGTHTWLRPPSRASSSSETSPGRSPSHICGLRPSKAEPRSSLAPMGMCRPQAGRPGPDAQGQFLHRRNAWPRAASSPKLPAPAFPLESWVAFEETCTSLRMAAGPPSALRGRPRRHR